MHGGGNAGMTVLLSEVIRDIKSNSYTSNDNNNKNDDKHKNNNKYNDKNSKNNNKINNNNNNDNTSDNNDIFIFDVNILRSIPELGKDFRVPGKCLHLVLDILYVSMYVCMRVCMHRMNVYMSVCMYLQFFSITIVRLCRCVPVVCWYYIIIYSLVYSFYF